VPSGTSLSNKGIQLDEVIDYLQEGESFILVLLHIGD
jgi:hypothetical protein